MERSKKRDTKSIGDRSEMEAARALVRAGYIVAVPFGDSHRYDLIVDKDGILSRVQVKTGRLRNGAVLFSPWSSHSHRNGPSIRTYAGEVEYIAVYCREIEAVFLVPIDDVNTTGTLRLLPTKNKQYSRVRWASAYLVREDDWAEVGEGKGCEVQGEPDAACRCSLVVKHVLGKDETAGSIPANGSRRRKQLPDTGELLLLSSEPEAPGY